MLQTIFPIILNQADLLADEKIFLYWFDQPTWVNISNKLKP